jgi:5S rRNA maturation endonuclease (ribonuclease M5)
LLANRASSQSDKVKPLINRLKEKEEKIEYIIAKLKQESAKGTPIIVEGKKDKEALCELGVEGIVLTAKTGGKAFLDVVSEIEQMGAGQVVLFLDFDRRGREGTKRLKQDFERLRIKPNTVLWRELAGLVSREIQCVESLNAYLANIQLKTKKASWLH